MLGGCTEAELIGIGNDRGSPKSACICLSSDNWPDVVVLCRSRSILVVLGG